MKKKTAGLTAILMTAVMATMMAGCGDTAAEGDNAHTAEVGKSSAAANSAETGEDQSSVNQEVDYSEHMDISVWLYSEDYGLYTSYDNNPVVSWWSDQYNMSLAFQQPAVGSESNQLTLMIGTGDYTDFFDLTYSQDSANALYEDGVIQDLTDYVKKYMPNYMAYLDREGNEDIKATVFDDEGRTFMVPVLEDEEPFQWGGLVYRRDILETMTGGNIQFPSGNDEPVTIEDWDYMLPLMKAYFDATGVADTACLIIPASGYFITGDLLAGFGIGAVTYVKPDGNIGCGPAEPQMYRYLAKMHEWYEKGYIYKDFASRTSDLMYMPNTALTYGGSAGIWYGILNQLGGRMSMPEYNLTMDVKALKTPLDAENNITEENAGSYLYTGRVTTKTGWVASASCDEDKIIRMLSALDYFYGEEGAVVKTMGLSTDENVQEYDVYSQAGFPEGLREPGAEMVWKKEADEAELETNSLVGLRLPGVHLDVPSRSAEFVDGVNINKEGADTWTSYGHALVYPQGVTYTAEESSRNSALGTQISDYINSTVPQFITGKIELTEETFQNYVDQLYDLGLEEYLGIKTAAYERYLKRME